VGFLSLNAERRTAADGGVAWHQLLLTWQRWDANWYRQIAEEGYRVGRSVAFFPLYPLLTRVVSIGFDGQILLAQLLVSSLAFAAAIWLLYRLARLEVGPTAAYLTVLLTACFPTAFFLLAPYTESLFLVLTLAAFWFARCGRPWAAGLAGFCAALTRAQAVFLVLPLAYEYLRHRRQQGKPPALGLLAAAAPALGWLMVAAFHRLVVGEQRSGLEILQAWGYRVVPPWEALAASWMWIATGGSRGLTEIEALNLGCLLGFLLLGILVARRLPFAYALYVWPSIALLLTREMWFTPLMSVSRYVLVLFPCFFVLAAMLVRRPRLAIGWLIVSALIQVVLMRLFARGTFVA
jgi:hypothetical protein